MTPDLALDICRRALETLTLVMAPILLSALCAGVLAGLFQAATQIQESTLAFVPKMAAMALALLYFGPWMLDRLRVFSMDVIGMIATVPR